MVGMFSKDRNANANFTSTSFSLLRPATFFIWAEFSRFFLPSFYSISTFVEKKVLLFVKCLIVVTVCMSVCRSVYLSVCPPVCTSVCLSVCPSVCLSVCLSVRQSVSPSVRLTVCPSVRPFV
jgi:hypothetical protein